MRAFLCVVLLLATTLTANAGDRVWLGKARLWTNDEIGDRRDRWRTGAYSMSFIRGREWDGALPSGFGDLVEYRFRGEVLAPASLFVAVDPTDRRLAGVLQVGAFSHQEVKGYDLSMGVDLVFVGPQTGMVDFQSLIHTTLGFTATPAATITSQLGNAVYPTFNAEISREFTLPTKSHRRVAIRPFLETQVGVETYARVGGDITFGLAGLGDFQVRDVTTGLRNIAIKSDRARGVSLLLGGDVAYVHSSQYLPTALGPAVLNFRARMRAGIYVEERGHSLFYGVTWLGREFVGQTSGQVLGSVTFRVKF